MTKSNKQLINLGLTQMEILELVQSELEEMTCINNIQMEGDNFTTGLWFNNDCNRSWTVYYENNENTDTLYVNSFKGDDLNEKNAKTFKSVSAVINHIKRVVGY